MSSDRALIWLKHRFIGDAVLATPLIHAVAGRFDTPDVLTAPHLKDLLCGEPGVRLIDNPKVKGTGPFLTQLRSIRRERYGVAILVNRSFRSALMARAAGIKRRIGFPTERRGLLLTDPVPYDPVGFEGDCYARLGDPLGLNVVARPPKLTLTDAELAGGASLAQGAVIGLLPGCTVAERGIPTEKSAEVIHALGLPTVLLGAPSEQRFVEPLLPLLGQSATNLVGACSLRQSMAVIANLKVVIGPDSGLIHVSAGLGVPTIATFCFSPASKWGHQYDPHTVLQTPDRTMATMEVEAVVKAAARALS